MTLKAILIAAGTVVALLTLAGSLRPRIDLAALQHSVAKSLPPGASSIEIQRFLDSLEIPHSGVVQSGLSGPTAWFIQGSVQDLRRPHLLSDGIFLQFRLDTSFRLLTADVHETWTLP